MTPDADAQHKPKVLVCDDDTTVRMLTRSCLEADNMVVIEAASGPEAVEVFLAERPDLVFLDVEMPGMDGLEVCRRIRELPQGENVPIMIVTGSDDRRSIDEGFDAGATQYKTKPVNWSLLSRDVQYMLRASNAFNALKRQEDRLRYLAYFDPLTNLPNRRSFSDQLTRILKQARRHEKNAALLFIDLDNFKRINDSIGHGRGDKLLVEIARRLTMELRQEDAITYMAETEAGRAEPDGNAEIARLGGDEFTVVLSDISNVADVEMVARRLLRGLSEPIPLQTHKPVVTPSIGIAIFPVDGADPDTLTRNADTAMYAAKAQGRACFRFYNEKMNAMAVEHLKLEEELRDAIHNDGLVLFYQPQVNSSSGQIVSMEALVRWPHPTRGMVMPGEFIEVAERTGLIADMGTWVMHEAARQSAEWEAQGLGDFRISVNLSSLQFNQPNFVDWVQQFLSDTGMNPQRLELELTESAIMTDAEVNIERLTALKEMGIEMAVDDFGTGYSSLSYLKQFPIDTLKIDQSFVSDMASPDSGGIIDAIIALAHTLGMQVIAEGVETEAQADYLIERECDLLQGYFFSHPVPGSDIPTLMGKTFTGQGDSAVAAN
ncbi:MAG: EAL domain-containing protein [Pseudomonadota bacterium]